MLFVLFRASAVSLEMAFLPASMAGSGLYPILVVVGFLPVVFLCLIFTFTSFMGCRLVCSGGVSSSSSRTHALRAQSF